MKLIDKVISLLFDKYSETKIYPDGSDEQMIRGKNIGKLKDEILQLIKEITNEL